jgi:hypothetical protein
MSAGVERPRAGDEGASRAPTGKECENLRVCKSESRRAKETTLRRLGAEAEEGLDGASLLGIGRQGIEVLSQAASGGEEGAGGGGDCLTDPDVVLA